MKACLALLAIPFLILPAQAADDALARLRHDLTTEASATQVLTQWCADLHLASPAVVHAERVNLVAPADAQVRALLKVGAEEKIGYRRVRLTCGGSLLSDADNWYVPARLTPQMNRILDTSDTPFGTVARPLDFHRRTLAAKAVKRGGTIFQVRALLLTPQNRPFSLVVENYQRALLGR